MQDQTMRDYENAYLKANGQPMPFKLSFEIGWFIIRYTETDEPRRYRKQDIVQMTRNLLDRAKS